MKIKRHAPVLALIAAGALALTACGSDDNTTPASPGTATGGDDAAVPVECGGKKALSASGATAQANAMTRFVTTYEAKCDGFTLNYNPNGSGAGVKDFTGKQTDLGGSDSPLSKEKGEYDAAKAACGSDAWNLPAVFGPVAVTYNVAGADGISLDGPTLAKIFQGQVSTWNDPAIAALNSGKTLPGDKIVVIFRSDESGTTDNFQKYLKTASKGAWAKEAGKVFNGGVGEGAKGNEGTSAAVKSTKGAITYNEWSFAKAQKLQIAKIVNGSGGEAVELTAESAGKSVAEAKIKGTGNDLVLDLDSIYGTSAQGAYPIVLATYEIVCSKYSDPEVAKAVKAFMTVAVTDGQKGLEENGYIPVPEDFQKKLLDAIAAIA